MKDSSDNKTMELPAFADGTLVTQKVAADLRVAGLVTAYVVARVAGGWVVRLGGAKGRGVSLRAVKTDAVRVFKSLDAAVSAVEGCGFDVSELGDVRGR